MALQKQEMYSGEDGHYYDAFVGQRDDTYFYDPLDLERIGYDYSKSNELNDEKRPYIFLENVCKWDAYSDKIHIGNQFAMTTLYGRSWNDYIDLTKNRIEYGHMSAHLRIESQTFQIEAFLEYRLKQKHAFVTEVDLHRVDGRYSNGTLCMADIYYNCQSDETQIILKKKYNIDRCFSDECSGLPIKKGWTQKQRNQRYKECKKWEGKST